jgi:hypothetical protein
VWLSILGATGFQELAEPQSGRLIISAAIVHCELKVEADSCSQHVCRDDFSAQYFRAAPSA